MGKIAKDSAYLIIARSSTFMFSLIYAIILSRYFSVFEYGTYNQILLISNFLISILALGLPNSVFYFVPRYDSLEDKRKIISLNMNLAFLVGSITFLLLFFGKNVIVNYFHNQMLSRYIIVIALLPLLLMISRFYNNIFIVLNKARQAALIQLGFGFSKLLLILFIVLMRFGFNYFIVLYFLLQLIFFIFVILAVYKELKGLDFLFFKIDLVKQILAYSVPLAFATVFGTLMIYIDKFMISYFFGTEKFAIYSNGARELPVGIVVGSITSVILPKIVRNIKDKKNKEAFALWKKSINYTSIFVIFIIFLFFLIGRDLIILMYSKKYTGSIPIFYIYLLFLFGRITYFGIMLSASGKTKYIMYSGAIAFVFNIVLNYIFIKLVGFTGPAWASLVSIVIMATYQLFYSLKLFRMKFNDVFDYKNIFKILLANSSIFAVLYLVKLNLAINNLLIEILIYAILYSIIYYGFIRFVIGVNLKQILLGKI